MTLHVSLQKQLVTACTVTCNVLPHSGNYKDVISCDAPLNFYVILPLFKVATYPKSEKELSSQSAASLSFNNLHSVFQLIV